MDTELREILDQLIEIFETYLLALSSSMMSASIVSAVMSPIFVKLQNYFLYSANMPLTALGCLVVCAFLAFTLCSWLYQIVADNKFSYFSQYPMWMKILDVVICWFFLGLVNYTFVVGGMAVLLSYAIIVFAASNSKYITDRVDSFEKDIAEQEKLKRKELLKNTCVLTSMDVYDILYMS